MEGLQEIKQLDPLLMNPKRLMIVALLYALGPRTMKQLVDSLGLTWGDLDSNIRRLREHGIVEVRKVPTRRGPRTVVYLTSYGERRFEEFSRVLEKVVEKMRGLREGR